jgi:hypothetical protein
MLNTFMNKHVFLVAGVLLAAAAAVHAQAQQSALTQAEMNLKWATKKVIVETYTNVAVASYVPPVAVRPEPRSAARYATPEQAASALLSAMAAGDYEWWLGIWSRESREMMQQRYRETGRQPADIVANWRGTLTERAGFLTGKAEYVRQKTNYALIRYKIVGGKLSAQDATGKVTDLGTNEIESTLVFKRSNDRWEAVQDLAADPVLHNSALLWDPNRTEVRISRPAE